MDTEQKKAILLVEDDTIVALSEKSLLTKYDFFVITAATGEEGVEKALSTPDIDLVLMDIDLGDGIDGTEAAARILAERELPVVFLSSHTERSMVERTEKVTSYGYIVKNSGETVIIAAIKMAFRLFEARKNLRDREEHYQSLFENAIGQVWLEDFSGFKRRLEELKAAGIADFRTWVAKNPQELPNLADTIRVIECNREAIRSIEPRLKSEKQLRLRDFIGPDSLDYFADELAALAEGKLSFETEVNGAFSGPETKVYLLSVNVVPGYERTLERVHVVLQDVSAIKQAEAAAASHVRLQRLLFDLSSTLIDLPAVNQTAVIDESLGKLATTVGADRAYVFSYDPEKGIATNTNEWCAEGIVPQREKLRALPLKSIAEALAFHLRGEPHCVPDVGALPAGPLRGVLDPQGIQSMITVPLMDDKRCVGCVGFDSVRTRRNYVKIEIDLLTVFSRILVGAERRRKGVKELRERERYLSAILETTQDGFWVLDETGRVTDVNEAYCKMSGYAREELLGLRIPDLEALETPKETAARIARIVANGSELFETKHRRKDGSLFDVEVSVTWLNTDAQRMVCFCRDITERKRSEKRIGTLLEEKELLLKETHHRVKNNLHTIHSLLTLQAEMGSAQCRESLTTAAVRVRSMLLLYETLFRSELQGKVRAREFLQNLVKDIVDSTGVSAPVELVVDVEDITLDAKSLSYVGIIVNELVTNSVKHAFVGIEHPRIMVSFTVTDGRAVLEYEDYGTGIPDADRTKSAGGFGLSLIRALTDHLEGRLEAPQGSRFRLSFPLAGD